MPSVMGVREIEGELGKKTYSIAGFIPLVHALPFLPQILAQRFVRLLRSVQAFVNTRGFRRCTPFNLHLELGHAACRQRFSQYSTPSSCC